MMEEQEPEPEPEPPPKEEEERQVERIIAQAICKQNIIRTLRETNEFCLWQKGVFIRGKLAETQVLQFISSLAEILVFYDAKGIKKHYTLNISRQNMILQFIRDLTYCSIIEFDVNPSVINVANGLYYLNGINGLIKNPEYDPTIPKDPEHRHDNSMWINGIVFFKYHDTLPPKGNIYKSFIQFPVEYDPKAECLAIDTFLTDVFGFDTVPLIYEVIGYILFGNIKYQKAFILYGPPASGKTTFINLLMRFLEGKRYGKLISQLRLQNLSDKFQLVKVRGKVLNIWDDLPDSKIGQSDVFRLIVTNDVLSGRVKYITENVSWENRCKLLFTCNTLPPVQKNVGYEFWRRWTIVPCFNEFKDKNKMTIEDEANPSVLIKNRHILDALCIPEEFSGLLNKAIQGYKRLHERDCFPQEWNDWERIKGLWQIDVNPIKLYLDECCEIVEGVRTDYYKFIEMVNEFREQHNAKSISATMVTQSLRRANSKIARSKDRKYYLNVKIVHRIVDGEIEEIASEGIDQYLEKLETESRSIERVDYSDDDRIR